MRDWIAGSLFSAALISPPAAHGQASSDSGRCRAALGAPVRDSQTTRVSLSISPFDTSNKLTANYAALIATGIRQFLVVPQPLALDTYTPRTALVPSADLHAPVAVQTMRSAYRAWLHRDGTFTQVRSVGGTRDVALDSALIAAVRQLSNSRELPDAVTPAATFGGDSVDVRLLATPDFVSTRASPPGPPAAGVTPLLQMRLPIVRVTQPLLLQPGAPTPTYPSQLRAAKVEGDLLFEFVVGRDGRVDLGSIQVLKGGAPEFILSVNDVLPKFQFKPMMVEGCAVRTLAQMPFQFHLAY